jgi:hypothetical protein
LEPQDNGKLGRVPEREVVQHKNFRQEVMHNEEEEEANPILQPPVHTCMSIYSVRIKESNFLSYLEL